MRLCCGAQCQYMYCRASKARKLLVKGVALAEARSRSRCLCLRLKASYISSLRPHILVALRY
jgi:hypothetical protein